MAKTKRIVSRDETGRILEVDIAVDAANIDKAAALPEKTAPDDTDNLLLAEESTLKRTTWMAVKNALRLFFDDSYATATALTDHTDKLGLHVTPDDRTAWNGKETAGSAAAVGALLEGHAADGVKHITAEERTAWNGKETAGSAAAVQTSLTAHVNNESNPHGVTVEQIGAAMAWHTHTPAQVGVGQNLTFTGAVTGSYNGMAARTINIPSGEDKITLSGYYTKEAFSTPPVVPDLFGAGPPSGAVVLGDNVVIVDYDNNENVYSKFFVKRATGSNVGCGDLAASANIGNYGLIAGGYTTNITPVDTVIAYNTSMVKSTPTTLSVKRRYLASASVGNYALFAGGDAESGALDKAQTAVDAYNTALVRSTPTALSIARHRLGGTSVGSYALFAGGYTSSGSAATVDAYNTSLVRSTPTALSVARYYIAGAGIGNYALFAGGRQGSFTTSYPTYLDTVDAYRSSLTRSTPTALGHARGGVGAASSDGFAAFAGGGASGMSVSVTNEVETYNTSLVREKRSDLLSYASGTSAVAIGGCILFAGGWGDSSTKRVTALATDKRAAITIPRMSAYKFDGHHTTEQITMTDLPWESAGALSGYIKRGGFTLSGLN